MATVHFSLLASDDHEILHVLRETATETKATHKSSSSVHL